MTGQQGDLQMYTDILSGSTITNCFPKVYSNTQINSILTYFINDKWGVGVGLWFLMPLSTMFQLYRGSQFYW